MPPRIYNYLKEGLPSVIYLNAYPEPISRYRISKQIYPEGKQISSKIMIWSKQLVEEEYLLTPKKDRILSNASPLVQEIETNLSNIEITLTEKEKKELFIFLDQDFRNYLKSINKKIFNNEKNAYSFLSSYVGFIAQMKTLIGNTTYNEIEKLNLNFNIPGYNPEQTKIIIESKLDKEFCLKLQKLSTLNTDPFIQIAKLSIELYQKNDPNLHYK